MRRGRRGQRVGAHVTTAAAIYHVRATPVGDDRTRDCFLNFGRFENVHLTAVPGHPTRLVNRGRTVDGVKCL